MRLNETCPGEFFYCRVFAALVAECNATGRCFPDHEHLRDPKGPLVSVLQAYLSMVPDLRYNRGRSYTKFRTKAFLNSSYLRTCHHCWRHSFAIARGGCFLDVSLFDGQSHQRLLVPISYVDGRRFFLVWEGAASSRSDNRPQTFCELRASYLSVISDHVALS
jgi:hypothetical protein